MTTARGRAVQCLFCDAVLREYGGHGMPGEGMLETWVKLGRGWAVYDSMAGAGDLNDGGKADRLARGASSQEAPICTVTAVRAVKPMAS
ncbi:hypothetical protein OG322_02325 [Streptomyces sp. NBC_01260]|uniref:hypothetical protein n=1 Tax=Streptomyces sp. NBC_01260 TaxID=2903801 RepID=UPI002E33D020|nr:hypothetical protein [Streptomyces sp. NBC_01260]